MLLQWDHVVVAFGGVRAVDDVSLDISSGGVTGIIGPNGAGKTTLLNVASGATAPTSGRIVLEGHDVTGASIHARAAAGMARTFQNLELFDAMTVREHVLVGTHLQLRPGVLASALRLPRGGRDEQRARDHAHDVMAGLGLSAYADHVARALPYGLQRRVELARALATRPRVLLLDEPMAGLSGPEAVRLADVIAELVSDGLTVLLVEHHMDTVMRLSTRVVVMNEGVVLADGTPDEVQRSPDVVAAYLGDEQWRPS